LGASGARKTNWAPLVPNLVPKNIGAEFGAEFLPELVPNMVPNWCRIIFGAKVVPNKIGRGAWCPNSKFCYGFTPLENWGAFWAATENWARNWGGIWAEIGAPIGAPIGARCLDAKIGVG